MKERARELSTQEMGAARLLADGDSQAVVAGKIGVALRTINRWAAKPEFIAYKAIVLAEISCDLKKKTAEALSRFEMQRPELIEEVRKIAFVELDPEKVRVADKIKALELLLTFYKATGNSAPGEAEKPEKPDIYQAAWMAKTN